MLMRVRLVHTQSLLLFAAVLLTVVSMGAFNAWSLRNGFTEFLAYRDVERLEQFAAYVAASADRAGGIDALEGQGMDLRELLRQFATAQGAPQRPLMQPALPAGADQTTGTPGAPGLPRPPPQDRANAFRERVAIYAISGEPLLGKSLPSSGGVRIERPIRVRGEVVATARMILLKPVQDDVESKFLASQYSSIAVVALGLLLVALASAHWVARRWVRPLTQVQAATERVAAGDFGFRLNDTRTDEIGDVMRNIDQMATALSQMDGARRQWIADISHELRTPLSVLRGEIDALMDGVRPTGPQAIASLQEEVLLLTALVDDLHFLSMSDMKALPCYFEEIDAEGLFKKIIHRFALRSSQLGIEIKLCVSSGESALVRWDAKRIGQLLGNVLDNSLRYTDAPGQLVVKLQLHTAQVLIDVDDTAPGVPASDLSRVFEPLYRADPARSRHTGGSGLGLAICAAIVKAHQGTIDARLSGLGGLHIHIVLPRFVEGET